VVAPMESRFAPRPQRGILKCSPRCLISPQRFVRDQLCPFYSSRDEMAAFSRREKARFTPREV